MIAFNSLEGILVNRATDNTIHQNSIFSNGPQQLGPGILLEAGGNDNQAAPTISSATTNANLTKLTITGMLNGSDGQSAYTLEFFANPGPAAMPDAEGKIYLGSLTIHPTTGSVSFATTLTVPATFSANTPIITATVTASNGDTSAFSAGFDDPPAAALISSASAATFTVGSPSQFLMTTSGLNAPALKESGAFPKGVTFNPATGLLSGTPAAGTTGVYTLHFTATSGAISATQTLPSPS